MELLKLVCWCKNISMKGITTESFFSVKDILYLQNIKLLSFSRDGKNVRPRPLAYHVLQEAGYVYKAESKPQSGASVLQRRNIASQIILTLFTGGINVFNDVLVNSDDNIYIASFAARQQNPNNPFGSTRFHGILKINGTAFLVFHLDETGVYFQKEIRLFHNLIEPLGIKNTAIIFMGNSTDSIGEYVFNEKGSKKSKKKYATSSFGHIYHTTSLPVHFIPIGKAGALSIKLLTLPSYRKAIAKAILKKKYTPPYPDISDTDTKHYLPPYNPAIIAIDMDVKRIDRAIENTKKEGFHSIAVYALPEQVSFLKKRYGNTGYVEIMAIQTNSLSIQTDINLYAPPSQLFISKEGRIFDVSSIGQD